MKAFLTAAWLMLGLAVLVAQMVLIVSEDGETAFVALCFAVE